MHQSHVSTNSPAPASKAISVPPLPEGWSVVNYAALADGALAILGANPDVNKEWRRDADGGMGDPYGVAASAQGRIWIFNGYDLKDGPAFPLLTPFPIVDRFPDGRWLVASARAIVGADARILSADGDELSRIHLGDGIERLKIDNTAHIWVGWFDEGVFGNEGWIVPNLEWPPSCYGLAAFDEFGQVAAQASDLPQELAISDCHAVNVIDAAAYACTCGDFPIALMSLREPLRWWTTELSGTRALAIQPPHVVAVGGYGEESDRAVLLRLEDQDVAVIREWRLPFKAGFPVSVSLVDGRGEVLHIVHEGLWHRWRVADFVAAAETS